MAEKYLDYTADKINTLLAKTDTTDLSTKQDTLVSGTNIKTINGTSILGKGDVVIKGGDAGELEMYLLGEPDVGDPYYLPEVVVPTIPIGISISTRNAKFTATTTLVLQIRLEAVPTADVTLTFTNGGNVTMDKQSMVFTPSNWGTVQYLELSYTGEELSADLTDTINITASGGNYNGMTDTIRVTILSENSGGGDGGDGDVDTFSKMRTATASDFSNSGNLENVTINSNGVVSGTVTNGAQYPALLVGGSGDISAIEWENGGATGFWIICGKSADGNYCGFGDASMGPLSYSGVFIGGGCSPQSGVDAEVNLALSTAQGAKFHMNRIGTVVSVYEYVNNEWTLKFKIDLASVASIESTYYTVNAIGLLQGSSYQLMKNVKVYAN